jgi:hypothetical protein
MLKKTGVDEGGNGEPQRGNISPVDCLGQMNNLGAAQDGFLGVGNNYLSGGCDVHAIASSDENRETNFILDLFDLLAQRRLRYMEPIRGSRKVSFFRYCNDVFQMSEFNKIIHALESFPQ